MTIFAETDFEDCPLLRTWTISSGDRGLPVIMGRHDFHEGTRFVVEEIYLIDPQMRWVIGPHGGYRLAGSRRALEAAEYGVNRH